MSLGWLKSPARGVRVTKCIGLLAAVVLVVSTPLAVAGGSATEAMKSTIDRVLEILADKELKKPDRLEERRRMLEKVVAERFSYEEMATRSLAAQWKALNENERKEFVELFQSLLTRTYADKVESYSGQPVQYVNERLREEGYAEVRTKVVSGKAEIPLDYRLTRLAGDWRVYDVVIDGVSLVSNYRGQFSKIIKSSSYADLVEKLRKKSDKIAAP
ncbi:MAG: ABC transporter substrate-binding protein [Nitrospira sp.]|nr:ABC transporter substrate-binding protein [Nitrospira sp.]